MWSFFVAPSLEGIIRIGDVIKWYHGKVSTLNLEMGVHQAL